MRAIKFSQINYPVLKKAFNRCIKCINSTTDFLFYPVLCSGEKSFRKKCVKFADLKAGESILDVCCGPGQLLAVLAGQRYVGQVVGVDISQPALEIARGKTWYIPVTFFRASADDLPFNPSRFDKCFISFGLHHMPGQERQKTLIEIHRVLAPDGALYIIDYNLPERGLKRLIAVAVIKLDESDEAYKMLKNESLTSEINKAGFEIEKRGSTCRGMIQLIRAVKK